MKNNPPLISLIFVNFNGRNYIQKCFKSLRQTNYPPEKMEIICVDNNSTDDSLAIIKKDFPEVKIIRNQNLGYGQGVNTGFRFCHGEYIGILNLDLIFHPEWINSLLPPLEKDPNIAITAPLLFSDDKFEKPQTINISNFSPIGFPYSEEIPYQSNPLAVCWVPGAVMITKRDIFEKTKGFDPLFFLYYEDFDWCFRCRTLGFKVVLCPKSWVYHRESGLIDPQTTSEKKVYWTAQNGLYNFLKNRDNLSLLLYFPPFIILKLADIIGDFFNPKTRNFAIVKTKALILTKEQIFYILKNRKELQKARIVSDKKILTHQKTNYLWKNIKRKLRIWRSK